MSFSWARLGKGMAAGDYYVAEMERQNRGTDGGRRTGADGYYTGCGQPPGAWWVARPEAARGLVRDGAAVDPATFRALLGGYDPVTGAPLVQRTGDHHVAGLDLTLSAPKSVSVLWACGDARVRDAIDRAQREAVRAAFRFLYDRGLFVTRLGKDGVQRVPAEDVMVAIFEHHTSRAGDPQRHSHGVIVNLGRGPDGKMRTLETDDILRWQGAIAAAYRVALADRLRQDLGVALRKVDRNFEVEGVPDAVLRAWSKRRTEIEEAARDHHFATAEDRARARVAAKETRRRKSELPDAAALEDRWDGELRRLGYTREAVVTLATTVGRPAAAGPVDREALGAAALAEATAHESVVEERQLWRCLLEHAQGRLTAEEAAALVGQLERRGAVLPVGRDPEGRPVYSTPAMIDLERRMIGDARERRDDGGGLAPAAVAAAIAGRPTLLAEQAALIRHVARGGGVVIGEGSAGTGKSFATAALVEAAEASGRRVLGFAPSWRAAAVLRRDSRLAETAALPGFLNRLDRGEEALTGDDVVIVDEAGMVGVRDMARLLHHARRYGAQVVLLGDRRQLEAVGPGSPLTVLAREVGAARMTAVQRQRDEVAADGTVRVNRQWMRAASMRFAEGQGAAGVKRYDAQNRVLWCADRERVLAEVVAAWSGHLRRHPEESRLVIAPRHADVRDLNAALRAASRALGRLTGADVAVDAEDRTGTVRRIALAVGERVTFGERLAALDVLNGDVATLTGLDVDPGGDHRLRFRLDRHAEEGAPRVLVARLSELVGPRPDPADRVPRLQHAYAGTNHLAQGQTVDRAFVVATHPLDARAIYVAMTRHRRDVQLFVDTDRLRGLIAERTPPGERVAAPTLEAVKAAFFREVDRQTAKRNVSDFIADRAAWLATGQVAFVHDAPPVAPAPDPLRERMAIRREQRAAGAQAPADPRAPASLAAEVDLTRFLAARGYRPVQGQPSYGQTLVRGAWARGRDGRIQAADAVIVSRDGPGGVWRYRTPHDPADRGTVLDYLARHDGLTPVQAAAVLRPWRERPASAAARQQLDDLTAQVAARRERRPEAELGAVRRRFAATPTAGRAEVLERCGLDAALAGQLPAEIRVTASGRCLFARRAAGDGRIVGYEVQGPDDGPPVARPAAGPGLFRVGDREAVARLVVCGSAVEALSRRQHDGAPAGTLYVSTGGRPDVATGAQLAGLVRAHPQARIEIALAADGAGAEDTARLVAALRAVRPATAGRGLADYLEQLRVRAGMMGDRDTGAAAARLQGGLGDPTLPEGVAVVLPERGTGWTDTVRGAPTPAEALAGRLESYQREVAAVAGRLDALRAAGQAHGLSAGERADYEALVLRHWAGACAAVADGPLMDALRTVNPMLAQWTEQAGAQSADAVTGLAREDLARIGRAQERIADHGYEM